MNVVTQIVVTVISSGVGAGIVTFVLNFLKGERDFLRSKLETLYLDVHKYTVDSTSLSAEIMTRDSAPAPMTGDTEHVNEMVVIIDLYFPKLRPEYENFRKLLSGTIVVDRRLNLADPDYRQKFLALCGEAERFERSIVKISKSHWLLRWGS
jgi:hypothetical protein